MKIRSLMISNPITIPRSASIQKALEVMKTNAIRHLPVVSENNRLEGFVTLADLRTGLIPSMVGPVSLADIMVQDPITVAPDQDIEVAAQLIYHHKIGGIPVVEQERLVGIITESDILRTFIDMMGILSASSRIDVEVPVRNGAFQEALRIIQEAGGDIVNVAMTGQAAGTRTYYFRLTPCKTGRIRSALESQGYQVTDAME